MARQEREAELRDILRIKTFEPAPYDDHPRSESCGCDDCLAWLDAKQDQGDREFHEQRDEMMEG